LTVTKKELQQARKDNQALARYINAKRKEEAEKKEDDAWKKAEEEAGKNVKYFARYIFCWSILML
jgi:hypothetical protein